MNRNGHIRGGAVVVPRRIFAIREFRQNHDLFFLYIWILSSAVHNPEGWPLKNRIVPRGTYLRSIRKLSEDAELSVGTTINYTRKLKKMGLLRWEEWGNLGTLWRITGYDDIQNFANYKLEHPQTEHPGTKDSTSNDGLRAEVTEARFEHPLNTFLNTPTSKRPRKDKGGIDLPQVFKSDNMNNNNNGSEQENKNGNKGMKSERMQLPAALRTRLCTDCGEIHPMNDICPLIRQQ